MGSLARHEVDGLVFHRDDEALAAAGVMLAFSERTGGVSTGAYASLNLGDHVGDLPAAVAENRRRFCAATGLGAATTQRLTSARQVHGTHVAVVDETSSASVLPATDALITATPGIPLLICTADCVPIILYAIKPRPVIAAIHSGWKGTLAEIVLATLTALYEQYGTSPKDVSAYIGAYIGFEDFEVSATVRNRFIAIFPNLKTIEVLRTSGEKGFCLDLAQAIRMTLIRAGVATSRISSLDESTPRLSERYFSYRAQKGHTGRQGALVCLGG